MECISVWGKMTARSVLLFLRSLMSEITEFYDMSIQQCHLWHGKLLCLVEEIAIYTSFHLKKKKKDDISSLESYMYHLLRSP